VQVRRGDLPNDENIDRLLYWRCEIHAITRTSYCPVRPPRAIFESRFQAYDRGIEEARWTDSHHIAFIAENPRTRVKQVFSFDASSGKVERITESDTDVVSFAVSGDQIIYFRRVPSPKSSTSVVVGDLAPWQLQTALGGGEWIELVRYNAASHRTERIRTPAVPKDIVNKEIWISPSHEYAIILVPALRPPAQWARYKTSDLASNYTSGDTEDPSAPEMRLRLRFQLVDLISGVSKPLLDAPIGYLAYTPTPVRAFWITRDRVILSHTFAPLGTSRESGNGPGVLEVNISTGKIAPIAWEPLPDAHGGYKDNLRPIIDLSWDASQGRLRLTRSAGLNRHIYEDCHRGNDAWVCSTVAEVEPKGLDLRLVQDLRTSPRLVSKDHGAEVTFFEPAPESATWTLGDIRTFEWFDSGGRKWSGGLVLPVGYVKGKRYPLVLQTHGFYPDEFLLEGPQGVTTAFAAQALANQGFVVLQVAESAVITSDSSEGPAVVDGWKTAIAELSRMGLVDSRRVGVIGWSRTGYHVLSALAAYPGLFAAAIISDSIQFDYTQYVFAPGDPNFLQEMNKVTRGPPFRQSLLDWMSQQPLYQIRQQPAAVRIESIGDSYWSVMWETYFVLRSRGLPVELTHFPLGEHSLQRPSERIASQGGSVEWFCFWLQNRQLHRFVDDKTYERWSRLKAIQAEPAYAK
jgi:hypothetical protein